MSALRAPAAAKNCAARSAHREKQRRIHMAIIRRNVPIQTQAQQALSDPAADQHTASLTKEEYAKLAEIARQKRSEQKKVVVSIRISPDTLEKAKATGKGYTGFLSRLLDNAINDPEMVEKSL